MKNRDLIAILQTRNPEHEVLIEYNRQPAIPVDFNCMLGTSHTIIVLTSQPLKPISQINLKDHLVRELTPEEVMMGIDSSSLMDHSVVISWSAEKWAKFKDEWEKHQVDFPGKDTTYVK